MLIYNPFQVLGCGHSVAARGFRRGHVPDAGEECMHDGSWAVPWLWMQVKLYRFFGASRRIAEDFVGG